uniref:Ig-like domain-containing protein n=1 Tax=Leptobrachium leishanense TaxID=445787 RepID=A0A8C5QUZ3_9ANUR
DSWPTHFTVSLMDAMGQCVFTTCSIYVRDSLWELEVSFAQHILGVSIDVLQQEVLSAEVLYQSKACLCKILICYFHISHSIPDKTILDKEKTLVCSVTDFYPVDITITWFRDGEIVRNSSLGKIQRNINGTYSVDSTVTITPNHEGKNQTVSCQVRHESLQVPLQEDFQLVYGGKCLQSDGLHLMTIPISITQRQNVTFSIIHCNISDA